MEELLFLLHSCALFKVARVSRNARSAVLGRELQLGLLLSDFKRE
jgi:hypothetical protein